MKIYFLQVFCDFNREKHYHYHYENVYSKKHLAIQQGLIMLEKFFRQEYESMFEENKAPKISRKKLFELNALYDFQITEYDPEYVYIFNYKGKRKEKIVMMHYENYKDSFAGTKKLGWLPEYCKFGNTIFKEEKNG